MSSGTDIAMPAPPRGRSVLAGYGLLLLAAAAIFFGVQFLGRSVAAPAAAEAVKAAAPKGGTPHLLGHVLAAIVTVVVCSRLVGALFLKLGQPRVIGEVVAGILLGPTLLGRIAPGATAFLFPQTIMPILNSLAQLGVILYMFLVGLELNLDLLKSRAHATVAISHSSIIIPFLLGTMLSLWFFLLYAPAGVPFTSFSLFMGIAMAITAFPVLARILTDQGLERSEIGVLALSCAAADDVTAWCLLAFVVGVAKAELSAALMTLVLSLAYIALVIGIGRPIAARRWGPESGAKLNNNLIALVLGGVLASSLITDTIGIHAIFGAFLIGVIIPHNSEIARGLRYKLEDFVTILLLPLYFAYTGMRTQIGLLSEPSDWAICGVIILAATVGKFGGTVAAGRLTGLNWLTSTALGILMNTRGLMELIVLNIGLDMGVISPTLFAMMVIMALVTTMATAPLLRWTGALGHFAEKPADPAPAHPQAG